MPIGGENTSPRMDLELLPEEVQAIGHVSSQWSFFEYHANQLMTLICQNILEKDLPKGFESDSFRSKLRVWQDIAEQATDLKKPDQSSLLQILNDAGSTQGERQRMIHSYFRFDEDEPDTIRAHSHKNPNKQPVKLTANRINDIAAKISRLNARVIMWPYLDVVSYLADNHTPSFSRTELLRRLRGDPPPPQPNLPSNPGNGEAPPK